MKTTSQKTIGILLVLTAGAFWGSMGLFVRALSSYGFTSLQITCMRMIPAALIFSLVHLCIKPRAFFIRIKDIPLFIGLGLGSVLFFTCCYFTAISLMSISTAAVLLYTAPIWVAILSFFVFKERFTPLKIAALVLSFIGCVLVSGPDGQVTFFGFLAGLGAGVGYALYSILGGVALRRYSPITVTSFAFLIASAGAACICQPADMIGKISASPSLVSLIGLVFLTGLVTAVIPYLCYTAGLQRIPAGQASILATVEPLVATVLGMLFLHEPLTLFAACGITCIVVAIVLLNIKKETQ